MHLMFVHSDPTVTGKTVENPDLTLLVVSLVSSPYPVVSLVSIQDRGGKLGVVGRYRLYS